LHIEFSEASKRLHDNARNMIWGEEIEERRKGNAKRKEGPKEI
jgi:hypothetical protein